MTQKINRTQMIPKFKKKKKKPLNILLTIY